MQRYIKQMLGLDTGVERWWRYTLRKWINILQCESSYLLNIYLPFRKVSNKSWIWTLEWRGDEDVHLGNQYNRVWCESSLSTKPPLTIQRAVKQVLDLDTWVERWWRYTLRKWINRVWCESSLSTKPPLTLQRAVKQVLDLDTGVERWWRYTLRKWINRVWCESSLSTKPPLTMQRAVKQVLDLDTGVERWWRYTLRKWI